MKTTVSPAAVRAWARSQGIEVGSRGVLAKDVVDRYVAAVGGSNA